jgi:hypothetical protein
LGRIHQIVLCMLRGLAYVLNLARCVIVWRDYGIVSRVEESSSRVKARKLLLTHEVASLPEDISAEIHQVMQSYEWLMSTTS